MKLDRLMGILTVLLQNKGVTAPVLARRFEVSRRTISRDIDALCMAGIPIITRQGGKGGISIAEGFALDKSVLTADDLDSLVSALKGMGSVMGGSQTERMLEKLGAGSDTVVSLRESVVIDLASHYKGSLTDKVTALKTAIQSCRIVEFVYYYAKGESHRRVEPYFVVFQWSAWYLFGFCLDRQDWRLFKLARLWNLKTCAQTYVVREIPAERRRFDANLTDHLTFVAMFHPSTRYQLIETYGLNCYTEMPDGWLRLEVGYTNAHFMTAWVLGFGAKAKVLEPVDIAQAVRREAEKMCALYQGT